MLIYRIIITTTTHLFADLVVLQVQGDINTVSAFIISCLIHKYSSCDSGYYEWADTQPLRQDVSRQILNLKSLQKQV